MPCINLFKKNADFLLDVVKSCYVHYEDDLLAFQRTANIACLFVFKCCVTVFIYFFIPYSL